MAAGIPRSWPHAKTTALGNLLRSHWPYTELQLASWRIGGIRKTGPPEWEGLRTVFGGTDLIFDATAEVGVEYFLSELSKDLGVPYLVASATEAGGADESAASDPTPTQHAGRA